MLIVQSLLCIIPYVESFIKCRCSYPAYCSNHTIPELPLTITILLVVTCEARILCIGPQFCRRLVPGWTLPRMQYHSLFEIIVGESMGAESKATSQWSRPWERIRACTCALYTAQKTHCNSRLMTTIAETHNLAFGVYEIGRSSPQGRGLPKGPMHSFIGSSKGSPSIFEHVPSVDK
jgi:hypothetical protein